MPELPEVETVRRTLQPLLIKQRITSAHISYAGILKNASPEDFKQKLTGKTFHHIERRGKYLIFGFEEDYGLVVHLRMTGQLRDHHPDDPYHKHNHFTIDLSNGRQLRFVDVRKFGMLFLGEGERLIQESRINLLGPEPLSSDFSEAYLRQILHSSKGNIKALLLNQHKIAGLGNIYADESLFSAGIHPASIANALPCEKISELYTSIRHTLQAGIDNRGTSINDYVDGFGQKGSFQFQLQVYRRTGEPCYQCGRLITRYKIAGRGTHVCTACQEKYL